MRKCKFTVTTRTYNATLAKAEYVTSEHEGMFVAWGLDVIEFEQGGASYSVGLVEKEDGSMHMVRADLIVFTDKSAVHGAAGNCSAEDGSPNNGSTPSAKPDGAHA